MSEPSAAALSVGRKWGSPVTAVLIANDIDRAMEPERKAGYELACAISNLIPRIGRHDQSEAMRRVKDALIEFQKAREGKP